MRLIVTGRHGQVAKALQTCAKTHRDLTVIPIGRPELDLAKPVPAIEWAELLLPFHGDVLVHCAAYTAVDQCETDFETAFLTNGFASGRLAGAAKLLHIPIIFLSTDYVFDGTKSAPYSEEDSVHPINAYGMTKLAGELAVRLATDDHVILRTAWVYAATGKSFFTTMLTLAHSRDEIRVVGDQCGNPTFAADIARAIVTISSNLCTDPQNDRLRGSFHLSGSGETTWAEFARAICAESNRMMGKSTQVISIASAEYPTPAKRPLNSRLDCTRLSKCHSVVLPDWKSSLSVCFDEYKEIRGE